MQSSCNGIHMLCSIQTNMHTDTSSHENIINHVTHHHDAMHAFHSFSSHLSVEGYAAQ
jgi:hypothetical protein